MCKSKVAQDNFVWTLIDMIIVIVYVGCECFIYILVSNILEGFLCAVICVVNLRCMFESGRLV